MRGLLNRPPSLSGDEPDYDAVGLALSKGKGYSKDFSDPDFWAPYQANDHTEVELHKSRFPQQPLADLHRPPGLPTIYAVTNLMFGRSMLALRGVNLVLAGLLLAMILSLITQEFRSFWVFPAALLLMLDDPFRLYSYAMTTETIAALSVTALLILLRQFQAQQLSHPILLGLLLGIAILFRTAFVLWIPVLLLGVAWLGFRSAQPVTPFSYRRGLGTPALFLLTTGLVLLPWSMRNISVTGEFWPLGLQGATQFSAAFGEVTWQNSGIWSSAATAHFYEDYDPSELSIADQTQIAAVSMSSGKAWIAQYPVQTLQLMAMKVWQEFRPRTAMLILLTPFILWGGWCLRKTQTGFACLTFILCCTTMVMATWSVEGRFIYPLISVWTVLAVAGANDLLIRMGLLNESPRCNPNTPRNDGGSTELNLDPH